MTEDYRAIIKEAIEKAPKRNFTEQVDVAFNLKDVDFKSNPKSRLKEEIILPHGRGKHVKVAIFASGETAVKAKGIADAVFGSEELEEMGNNLRRAKKIAKAYDFFIAEAPFMIEIGKKIGRALGPRDKMPRPIPPGADPKPVIENLRKTVKIRTKEYHTFHVTIGSADMDPAELEANFIAVMERVKSRLERGAANIKSVFVKTTMGPALKLL